MEKHQGKGCSTKRIKLLKWVVHEKVVRTLLDFGSVQKVTSADLYARIHLEPRTTIRKMKMIDKKAAKLLEVMKNVTVSVRDITKGLQAW